jgi:hypothetical protein
MKRHVILVAVLCAVFAIGVGYAAKRSAPGPFDTRPNFRGVPRTVDVSLSLLAHSPSVRPPVRLAI